LIVPTKQCGSTISISYILWLLLTHNEKSGVCKVQGGILKPALLCRDYLTDVYAEVMELNAAIDIGREGAERITSAWTLTGKAMAFLAFANSVIKFAFT
jgi:hypothetical protein